MPAKLEEKKYMAELRSKLGEDQLDILNTRKENPNNSIRFFFTI